MLVIRGQGQGRGQRRGQRRGHGGPRKDVIKETGGQIRSVAGGKVLLMPEMDQCDLCGKIQHYLQFTYQRREDIAPLCSTCDAKLAPLRRQSIRLRKKFGRPIDRLEIERFVRFVWKDGEEQDAKDKTEDMAEAKPVVADFGGGHVQRFGSIKQAARHFGVSPSTIRYWLKKGTYSERLGATLIPLSLD
jgi:hypothetical protein